MTDYSNMTLREELEARFADAEKRQKEADFLTDNTYCPVAGNEISLPFHNEVGSFPQSWLSAYNNVYSNLYDGWQSFSDEFSDQVVGSLSDMAKEYFLMHSHNYKNLDDYYHCKANYNAAARGPVGNMIAAIAGNGKEAFDYFKNRLRGLPVEKAVNDYWHDLNVNAVGRERARNNPNLSAAAACSDYRRKNRALPEKYR